MSLKENLKAESQREKAKLKNMSGRDRIWYIWEYYKLHMLAAAAILFILYMIGNVIYNSTFENRLSYMVINNSSMEPTNFETFNQEFKDYMGYGKKDRVTAEGSIYIRHDGNSSELEYASMAKISALVASNSLDMMIMDQANADHYNQLDAFADLEQLLPEDLWQQVKDYAYYAPTESGEEIACAIDINHTCFPERTGVSITPCYLGVVKSSNQIDTVIEWIRFLLNSQ
ncbi:MAG: hypothetical protein Q4F76_05150 [Lachnospiraceae bacterium]|nr:hypothetical protein [Lachnospiraceae bacterium]